MAEDLLITLGVKDQGTGKQIQALNREIKYLDREFKTAGRTTKDFERTQQGLQSKMKQLERTYDATKQKLDVYKKRMTETKQAIANKEKELAKLTNTENVNEKAVEKVSKQLDSMRNSLRQTEQNINLTEMELENLTQELEANRQALNNQSLEKYKQEMQRVGEQIERTGEKMQRFGQGMSTLGGNLMKLSAPLVAFAAYAVKVSMDFEQGMAKVQAISGATGKELEMLKAKAQEMGRITKFSASESAEALSYMAMAGWKAADMANGLEGIMNLAAASSESLALVSDIVTDALSAFGMQAKDSGKFADILASASSNANTNVAMMGETFKYVAPIAGAMKYSAEDTAVAIGLMANSGIKASQAGTSLRQILMGLQGGVEVATAGSKKFRIEVENSDGTMRGFRDVLVDLREAFSLMSDAQKASNAENIAGKVGMSGLLSIVNASEAEFNKLTQAVDNSTGSAKKMADTMNNTAQGQLTLLKSQLEGLGIQVGEKLLPHINNFIEKLSKLIEWFGNLGEGTQQTIVKMGLMTFAMGGALKSIGSLSMGIGSLVSLTGRMVGSMGATATAVQGVNTATSLTAVGGVGRLISSFAKFTPLALGVGAAVAVVGTGMKIADTHSKMLSKTVLDTTDSMSGMEKALNSLNDMNFKSRAELERLGLVYKDFGKNISEEFQNAVKTSQKTLNDFNMYLREINLDKVIDEEEQKQFTDKIGELCKNSIDIIKAKEKEANESLSNMFKLDDQKIDENEQKILEMLKKQSGLQIEEVNKLEQEILGIKDNAVKEKRALNEEEIKDIEAKIQRIKEIELEALGGTQEEILYAKNEFSARMATLDLEGASTLLQEKAKLRDEEIVKIQASYDTQLQMLEAMLETEKQKGGEANQENIKNLEEQIAKHSEAKDTKIQQQYELYEELLRITGEKNPEILAEINRHNGEILTAEDKKSQERLGILQNTYAGLNGITENGTYLLENTQNGSWQRVSVMVDQNTGKIIAATDNMYKKGGANSSELAKAVQDMAKKHNDAQKTVQDTINKSGDVTVDASGKIVNANGDTILSLENVETAADGTRKGIISLNGENVEIKVNKDGTIESINAINKALNNATRPRTVTITTKHIGSMAPTSAPPAPAGRSIPAPATYNTAINPVMPVGVDNIITDGGYYNSRSQESKNLVNTFNTVQAPKFEGTGQGIDYNKLANIMASTMITALNNLEINNNITNEIDGTKLYGKFSNKLAVSTKGRR